MNSYMLYKLRQSVFINKYYETFLYPTYYIINESEFIIYEVIKSKKIETYQYIIQINNICTSEMKTAFISSKQPQNVLTQSKSYNFENNGIQGISLFVSKTYDILQKEEFQNIIKWMSNGESFIILNVQNFQKEVLPKYFRHSNFSSFVRQLNMYGFHKSRKHHDKSIFSHLYFRKNRQDLLDKIQRKPKQVFQQVQSKKENQIKNFQTTKYMPNQKIQNIATCQTKVFKQADFCTNKFINSQNFFDFNDQFLLNSKSIIPLSQISLISIRDMIENNNEEQSKNNILTTKMLQHEDDILSIYCDEGEQNRLISIIDQIQLLEQN